MASTAEDYGSELQELQWGLGSSSSGYGGGGIPGSTHHIRTGAIGGSTHFRGSGSCYEAEDLEPPMSSSSSSRHLHHGGPGHTGSLQRGYYSPPGTSYTIVERPPSAPQHHSSHTTPYRSSSSHRSHTTSTTLGRDPSGAISPEQVIRLFGAGNGLNDRRGNDRRTPASSPASVRNSSTQQLNAQQSPPVPQALSLQELTVRTITMTRDPPDSHHGFGICVKGGKDAGVGVYISRVEEGSVAERAGLRPGDTILEVNGTPFRAVTHEEALKMLKSCRMLSMTVRGPAIDPRCRGGHPIYPQNRQQTCSWMDRQGRPASPPPPSLRDTRYGHRTRKVDLCIEPGQSLGLMIRGGLEYGLGIYVTGVDKDSVADRAGLLVGDQILEVNGQSFEEATHDEAVQILKTNKRMSLLIRDVGKVPHSCTTGPMPMMPVSRYQDHDSLMLESPPGNHRPPSPASSISDWRQRNTLYPSSASSIAMVEEKARVVLARSERAALSQLLSDYRMRRINVEDLVVSLGDLLNTHEKLTLLTELREIVDSKDRPIFDDLVYRPRLSRRKNDRAHNSDLIVTPSLHELPYDDEDMDEGRGGRRHSSPGSSRNREYLLRHHLHADNLRESEGSDVETMMLGSNGMMHRGEGLVHRGRGVITEIRDRDGRGGSGLLPEDEDDLEERDERSSESGGFGGWRNHIFGGLTQRVKSWYWGARPLELAHKMSRSFDMQEAQLLEEGSAGGARRHHSAQRLARDPGDDSALITTDHQGNLRIIVKKCKPTLGIAIEGGANTKHPLPRIINIHDNGAAYDAGGLEVGQLILEVDGHKVEGLHHQEVARLIAESFARRDRNEIEFLVVEAKKSNLEPKPTALIFLEA